MYLARDARSLLLTDAFQVIGQFAQPLGRLVMIGNILHHAERPGRQAFFVQLRHRLYVRNPRFSIRAVDAISKIDWRSFSL